MHKEVSFRGTQNFGMTNEHLAKHENKWLSPYVIIALAWCFLGIGSGIVAQYALARLIFIGISWFLFEAGWDYLEYFKRMSYSNENEDMWTKLKLRVISYARPLFYVWLGSMVHHIIWWESNFVVLDKNRIGLGWGQSAFVLFCSALSFLGFFAKHPYRRNYLKWMMMIVAFLLPPWRLPWYMELVIVIQARWMIMVILFVVQCFESYTQANIEKRYLADLYLLRIGWIPIVHPILLLFSIVTLLYYGFTMIRIRIETALPQCDPLGKSQSQMQGNGMYYSSNSQQYNGDLAQIMDTQAKPVHFTLRDLAEEQGGTQDYRQVGLEQYSLYARSESK